MTGAGTRLGLLDPQDLTGFAYTREAYDVGSWSLTLPASHRACAHLSAPGARILVTEPDGRRFSGPVTRAEYSESPDDGRQWTFTGASDAQALADMVLTPRRWEAYGSPPDSETWTGRRASLMAQVWECAGFPGVTCDTQGTDAILTVDWQTCLEGMQSLANRQIAFGANWSAASGTVAWLRAGSDLTGSVTLGMDTGALTSLTVRDTRPAVTRIIARSQSTGGGSDARTYTEVTPSAGASLETAWSARVEEVCDLENGETPESRAAKEISGAVSGMTSATGGLASDILLDGVLEGDTIAVRTIDGRLLPAQVTSVSTGFGDGPVRTATLGDWSAGDSRVMLALAQRDAMRAVRRIDHRTWTGTTATTTSTTTTSTTEASA